LFKDGSYSTSIFLSITAIEEVSKVHIGLFRREGQTIPKKRREDLLFNHNAKHSIALQGTIKKGTRLTKAIGEVNLNKLLDLVEKGILVKTREEALYSDSINGKFVTPAELFSKEDARNILLLAIESWDDNLVGYDEHTYDICKKTDEIFNGLVNIDL
jgi:AbiV family abortive infection protein